MLKELIRKQSKFACENTQYVKDLCKPLFSHLGLNYFHHRRIYLDGSSFSLITNPDWLLHSLERGLCGKPDNSFETKNTCNNFFFFGNDVFQEDILNTSRNGFDIYHPLSYNEIQTSYIDSYCFAVDQSKKNNNLSAYYLNALDLIKKFVFYYQHQAKELIVQAEKQRISPIITFRNYSMENSIVNETKNTEFLNSIIPNKIYCRNKRNVYLTRKEYLCIKYLAKGMTAKGIADILNLSPRTIEDYIGHVMQKLACENKLKLLASCSKEGLI